MGDKITLKLDERTAHGKKVAKLRKEGMVPGVVYGAGFDPISVQAGDVVTAKVYHTAGKHAPVHLSIGNKRKIAMIKDVDIDPVKHTLRHVSFHAVKQNEKIEAEIPVKLIGEGESDAEKAGLVILQNIEHLEVKAFPMDLPEALEVDIAHLSEAGQRVTVGDITLPENVELVDDLANQTADEEEEERQSVVDLVIASVYEPSALAAANDAAGGDAEAGDESEVEAEQGEGGEQPNEGSEDKTDDNAK